MTTKTTNEVLRRARDTLNTARLGLKDVLGAPDRRLGGLRNLVVFGRAVTNVLQNLRATETRFDQWYSPYVAQMTADPLLRYLYELRTQILKEGALRTSSSMYISEFEFPRDMQRLGPPPAGARAFFMGDKSGGSGWEIAIADGSVEKFYVDIPGDIATVTVTLPAAPSMHLGHFLLNRNIETIAQAYFDYLSEMVASAEREFGEGKH